MARMLGRWLTGGCGCCSGREPDTRRRKRREQREVQGEYRMVLIERYERPAAFFDERDLAAVAMYGDDEADP